MEEMDTNVSQFEGYERAIEFYRAATFVTELGTLKVALYFIGKSLEQLAGLMPRDTDRDQQVFEQLNKTHGEIKYLHFSGADPATVNLMLGRCEDFLDVAEELYCQV